MVATFKISSTIESDHTAYFALCDTLRAITDPSTETGRFLASLSGTIYITESLWAGATNSNASWLSMHTAGLRSDFTFPTGQQFYDLYTLDENKQPVIPTGTAYDPSAAGFIDLTTAALDPSPHYTRMFGATDWLGTAHDESMQRVGHIEPCIRYVPGHGETHGRLALEPSL